MKNLFEELSKELKGIDFSAALNGIAKEGETTLENMVLSGVKLVLDKIPSEERNTLLSEYITTDLAINHIITNEVDILDYDVKIDPVEAIGTSIPDIQTAQIIVNRLCIEYPDVAKMLYSEMQYHLPQEDKWHH